MRFSVFSPSIPNEFFDQLSDSLNKRFEFNVIQQDELRGLAEGQPLLFMDKAYGSEKISKERPIELKDCKAQIVAAFYFAPQEDRTIHTVKWSYHLVRIYHHNGSQLIDVPLFKSNLEEVSKTYASYEENLKNLQQEAERLLIKAAPTDLGLIKAPSSSPYPRISINKIAMVVLFAGTIYTAFKAPQNLPKFIAGCSMVTFAYNALSHIFRGSMYALNGKTE